jgi:AraC family transcriptional regulator
MNAPYRRGSGAPCLAYTAIRRLPVVRWATQVDLFKALVKGRAYISQHYAVPGVIQAAAREAGISSFHFTRLFTRLFGVSPSAYRTGLRLRTARDLLASTDLTVAQVCEQVGFASVPSFTQLFRRRFGASPAQFRASRQICKNG